MLAPRFGGISFYCIGISFKHTVPENLKTGVILPLFKGREAKANNKDSYRGITMFRTLCKVYEMILQNRQVSFLKCSLAYRRVFGVSKLSL